MTPEQKKEYNKQYGIKNREKILANKREYARKNKEKIAKYRQRYYAENKEDFLKKQHDYYATDSGRKIRMLTKAKERAAKVGLAFSITAKDLHIPTHCPYTGLKLTHRLGQGQLRSNSSIDRIDSSLGYIPGNVQVISRIANTMKSDATQEELVNFAVRILNMELNLEGQTVLDYANAFRRYL